ncbi:sensor domain-containing protein [Natronobeatus ordinarius]|uniref:sensor domain-containing protein n=1 Tax=Natronobeatus ordinarius TaxID=2963433 RepID=UPI0020CB7CDD|nr:sensor domain-containing protein [Natronobeatus ordinarius]
MNAAEVTSELERGGRWFVGVAARRQTYYNLLYLLLTFPLGVAYFTFLVTGFVTSGVLIILLVGIPMLLVVLFLVNELSAAERGLAAVLLDVDIPASEPPRDLRERAWRLVFSPGTWLGVVYLFSKFVIGVVTFVLLVFGLTFTYALVTAPFHYQDATVGIYLAGPIEFVPEFVYQHDGWTIDVVSPVTISIAEGELVSVYADSLAAALVISGIGVVVGLGILHLFNGLAWLYGKYTEVMLSRTQPSIFTELQEP